MEKGTHVQKTEGGEMKHNHTTCKICAEEKKWADFVRKDHAEAIIKDGKDEVVRIIRKYLEGGGHGSKAKGK